MIQGLEERDDQPRYQEEGRRAQITELDLDDLFWVITYRSPLSPGNLGPANKLARIGSLNLLRHLKPRSRA